MQYSKALSQDDSSGFEFVTEILNGEPTYAINFDRVQYHPQQGYIIFEYLRCHESQRVTPHTSHPNRYFNKNKFKFISLFNIAKDLNATLYLVNYAKLGTEHDDKIKVMKVLDINERQMYEPVKTQDWDTNRENFGKWFRQLNRDCAV
ncbi:hypothetical protein [Lonepinella sp. BR2919]|uniref:hypothetical protein n=1 Tax=unclassified Lonepinella TaxID=2642006 RepID=UPI003F6DF700